MNLCGISIDYSDWMVIRKDAEDVLAEMRNKLWNKMIVHEAAVQFADSLAN